MRPLLLLLRLLLLLLLLLCLLVTAPATPALMQPLWLMQPCCRVCRQPCTPLSPCCVPSAAHAVTPKPASPAPAAAAERMLGRLKGLTDPEAKRKAIGADFIDVFRWVWLYCGQLMASAIDWC